MSETYTKEGLHHTYTEGVADTISVNAGRFSAKPLTPVNPYQPDDKD